MGEDLQIMDPLQILTDEFRKFVRSLMSRLGIEGEVEVERAPPQHGYLTARLHKYSKSLNADLLSRAIDEVYSELKPELYNKLSLVGWYLNVEPNVANYAKLVLNTVSRMGDSYGVSEGCRKDKVLIEHTSANPIHPLHIGHARNSILGDSLARLLRFCGADVETHFYVNDCGVQAMYAVYGYSRVRERVAEHVRSLKPDWAVGIAYSMTYAIAQVNKLKRRLNSAPPEEVPSINREIDEWVSVVGRHLEESGEYAMAFLEALDGEDVEAKVLELNRGYEEGVKGVVSLVREVVELALEGQRRTLECLGIHIDSWDWESEIAVWSSRSRRVVEELVTRWRNYVELKGGTVVFRANKFAEDFKLAELLNLPKFIPPVTLLRSDGTTLYVTRDVAYCMWQHKGKPDLVIRVIASEQTHEQAHVRLALYALGLEEEARRTLHYSYEMVVTEKSMSARRWQFVPVDDIVEEAKARIASKSQRATPDVVEKVAVGAIRYAFLSVNPKKPMTFKWDVVLDMSQNSGPFVQYTYVRAKSITSKAGSTPSYWQIPEELSDEERKLVLLLGEWPSVVAKASQDLRVDYVTEYVNRLALEFNKFYERRPVLQAEEPYREFRLALVNSVRQVLENAFRILGIPTLERM